MPLCDNVKYIHEPTPLQCGQAVLAMLSEKTVDEVVKLVGTQRETKLCDMLLFLHNEGISFENRRVQVNEKSELPEICILSLETPRCWHWSLYYKGVFYDPEHGVLYDFPTSNRKYYWKING